MDLFWCKENDKCKTKQHILLDIGTGVNFCRGDSWKSVSYSRLKESLNGTSYCEKAAFKSGFR